MTTTERIQAQGRTLRAGELEELQGWIDQHPHWSRQRVAQRLCERWDWRTPRGVLKTFAARSLLLTLAQRHNLRLPALREEFRRPPWGLRRPAAPSPDRPPPAPISAPLASLQPLHWQVGGYGSPERERALSYLRQYHYLGCNRPVGVHLVYLVQDRHRRDLAVHLVGAAAWQCAARDRWIGWSAATRPAALHRIANHNRFLILPWVAVPELASHVLGQLTRRISADWRREHGWGLELLETFVEAGRFVGTAYRAANWQWVGQTAGRTRQEKAHRAQAPRKQVWVYALARGFRPRLQTNRGGTDE